MQPPAGADEAGRAGEKFLALEHDVALILAQTATASEAYPKLLEAIATSLGWQFGAVWEEEAGPTAFVRCVATWCGDAERLALSRVCCRPRLGAADRGAGAADERLAEALRRTHPERRPAPQGAEAFCIVPARTGASSF